MSPGGSAVETQKEGSLAYIQSGNLHAVKLRIFL